MDKLINECLRRGSIPDGWRGSTVKMLYKGKGKVDDPNAYRGIALECALFKIMTKILTERMTDLTDHHIPEQQFGFRRGRSTLHAVFTTRHRRGSKAATEEASRNLYRLFQSFRHRQQITASNKTGTSTLEGTLPNSNSERHTRPQ